MNLWELTALIYAGGCLTNAFFMGALTKPTDDITDMGVVVAFWPIYTCILLGTIVRSLINAAFGR